MAKASLFGMFRQGRWEGDAGYVLSGEITMAGVHNGRPVELRVSRERLQSLVVNLTAESGLFRPEATGMEAVNRLRLLCLLGVPEQIARQITGVYPEGELTSG